MMIALDGSVASIALIGSARAATGWQIGESFYLGPEVQALWCIDYHEWRLGAHITAFRLGGIKEWAAAAGAASTRLIASVLTYAAASSCVFDFSRR